MQSPKMHTLTCSNTEFSSSDLSDPAHAGVFYESGQNSPGLQIRVQLVNDEDKRALRRLKNRESARRVRARRVTELDELKMSQDEATKDNVQLRAKLSASEAQNKDLRYTLMQTNAVLKAKDQEIKFLQLTIENMKRPTFANPIFPDVSPLDAVTVNRGLSPSPLFPQWPEINSLGMAFGDVNTRALIRTAPGQVTPLAQPDYYQSQDICRP